MGFSPLWFTICAFNFPLNLTCFIKLTYSFDKMGFWVSLYFNNEQVRKGVKRFHMLVVSLSSVLWNVGCMHVSSFPHLLGKLIKHYYCIVGKKVIRKLMKYCPTIFWKKLWNGWNGNEEKKENKSFILLLNAKFFITYANNIYIQLLMVMNNKSTNYGNWRKVSKGWELISNVPTSIKERRPLKGGVKVNCSQAHHYHLTFKIETIQLLMENEGIIMVTCTTTSVSNVSCFMLLKM
jgi:hypothetical protein